MKLSSIIISLLVFAVLALGISNFASNYAGQYGQSVENVTGIVNTGRIQNLTQDISNTFNETTTQTYNILDVPFTIGTGAYQVLKLVFFGSIDLYAGFANSLSTYLHIPSIYVTILISIITIGIIFLVISAILKWRT